MAAAVAVAVALLVSLAAAADSSNISYEEETRRMFAEWKAKFGQAYKDAGEEECRYALFKDSRRRIDRANAADAGVTRYGLNRLSCLTREEIRTGCRGRGVRNMTAEGSYEQETRRMFAGWKAKHGKAYRDVGGEECRYKLFKTNRRVVDDLNAAAGGTPYGLNQFGDLTNEEIRASCYGRRNNNPEMMEGKLSARCQATVAYLPDTVHGRIIGTIQSQVKRQIKILSIWTEISLAEVGNN
ncbi:unnamed protein product [Urochloa decumbens]|uniref:Cathepsin propeptide inhibitor domain-containing protein n=1 Tax=Urochloa decumbens TaxID=240449 RepID=A0ABC9D260_9POAL